VSQSDSRIEPQAASRETGGTTTRLAIIQMHCTADLASNVERAEAKVREAAAQGADIILLPELFESLYFPQIEREELFALAHEVEGHPFLDRFEALARELGVVLPVSFFEKAGQAYFNSLLMIDADGSRLGVYRKSHIPDGPGYEEKYYFNVGDTGFKAWDTRFGKIGVAICWDQWFPEAARAMAMQGADLLLYPTAIGSEPLEAGALDTRLMWHRVMTGHAVANIAYVGAANRVGREDEAEFYGSSFISDPKGDFLAEAGSDEALLLADLDFAWARRFRAGWGFFRDRRPELYGSLLTLDGRKKPE
jgi:N-carbamoylputrescine amidase